MFFALENTTTGRAMPATYKDRPEKRKSDGSRTRFTFGPVEVPKEWEGKPLDEMAALLACMTPEKETEE